jgi:phage internal scaffolding protein
MIFKTAYGENPRVRFSTNGPSLTHQSMAPECDINTIMARWQKTGVLEHKNNFQGQYGDFTNIPDDYHQAMNAVLDAEEMFSSLPSGIRKKFGNDPGTFIDFAVDPSNIDSMVEMGLAESHLAFVDVVEPPRQKEPQKAPKPGLE